MVLLTVLKEDLRRYKENANLYKDKLKGGHKDSKYIRQSLEKLEKEIEFIEKLIDYGESILSEKPGQTATIQGIESGDYECFCIDVDKETYVRVKGSEPDEYAVSYFNEGLFRLYPTDLIDSIEPKKIRMTIEVLEED